MVSIVNDPNQHDDDDRRSTSTVASTVATTASLASRIASLVVDFHEKFQHDPNDTYEHSILEGNESSYSDRSSEGYEDPEGRNGDTVPDDIEGTEEDLPSTSTGSYHTAPRFTGRRGGMRATRGALGQHAVAAAAVAAAMAGAAAGVGGAGTYLQQQQQQWQQQQALRQQGGTESPDAKRPLFSVCSRLFVHKGNHPLQLKRMTINQVEDLKLHGYVVIDNFVSRELSAQVKNSTANMYSKGRLIPGSRAAAVLSTVAIASGGVAPSPDTLAPVGRGDHVMWLSVGRPPADTPVFSQLLVAFQELQEDVHEFVRLRRTTGEYQVAYHPPGSAGMGRHRDAPADNGREDGFRRLTCICCCSNDWLPPLPPAPVPAPSGAGCCGSSGSASAAGESSAAAALGSSGSAALVTSCGSGGSNGTAGSSSSAAPGAPGGSGGVRIWPPRRNPLVPTPGGLRHSLGGSEAGTSELSDSGSLRSHHHYGATSVTSSMFPEASMHEHDAGSVDGSQADGPDGQLRGIGLEWVEVDGEMVLEVAPLPGRLLIFLSGAVDHSLLPCDPQTDLALVTSWLQ